MQEPEIHPEPIYVNARFRRQRITGVQRYATEILARIGGSVQELMPRRCRDGIKGHAWEQFDLAYQARGGFLWNPCATGPLIHRNFAVTVHDLAFLDHPEWFSPAFGALYGFLVPRLIRRAKSVIAVSNFTKGRILHWTGIPESKITVIPHAPWNRKAIAEQVAGDLPGGRADLAGHRFILSACSLEPRKNLKGLLEAWQEALPQLPGDVVLVVTGGTAGRVFARQETAIRPERVIFTGYVSDTDLDQLLAHAEAFIYPSFYEGFGLPPLEAMHHGCPVLASNAASIPEVTGNAAILFDPTRRGEIVESIVRVLNNASLRQHLSEAGKVQAARFSWEISAIRTQEVLLRAAGAAA